MTQEQFIYSEAYRIVRDHVRSSVNVYSRLHCFGRIIPDVYDAICIDPPYADHRGTLRHQDFMFEMRHVFNWQSHVINELATCKQL